VSDRQSCPGTVGCPTCCCHSEGGHDECRPERQIQTTSGVRTRRERAGRQAVHRRYRLGQRGSRGRGRRQCWVARDRFTVAHRAADLRRLVARLHRAGVEEVAIERGDGPVVDALAEGGLTVFVIAPNQLKNLRSRYGQAGNKDDRLDAFVLADTLRTDRARLRPLTRDCEQTLTLRMTVRARQDLVRTRVALGNQLRAHLQITLPGAVGLFRDIDSDITLAFLRRFPSQDKADWLSPARLERWLRGVGYNHLANRDRLWAHLHGAARGTTGAQAPARAQITLALVAALTALRQQIAALDGQIAEQLAAHPDAEIFTSLPRSGTVRAARLLAEIGDARGRYPTPEALTCPVTPELRDTL
jgi:transposase